MAKKFKKLFKWLHTRCYFFRQKFLDKCPKADKLRGNTIILMKPNQEKLACSPCKLLFAVVR